MPRCRCGSGSVGGDSGAAERLQDFRGRMFRTHSDGAPPRPLVPRGIAPKRSIPPRDRTGSPAPPRRSAPKLNSPMKGPLFVPAQAPEARTCRRRACSRRAGRCCGRDGTSGCARVGRYPGGPPGRRARPGRTAPGRRRASRDRHRRAPREARAGSAIIHLPDRLDRRQACAAEVGPRQIGEKRRPGDRLPGPVSAGKSARAARRRSNPHAPPRARRRGGGR